MKNEQTILEMLRTYRYYLSNIKKDDWNVYERRLQYKQAINELEWVLDLPLTTDWTTYGD